MPRPSRLRWLVLPAGLLLLGACADVLEPPTGDETGVVPLESLEDDDVVTPQVAAGVGFTCALRSEGIIECWGGYASQIPTAVRGAASGHYTKVAAGFLLTCALRDDGGMDCWEAHSSPNFDPVTTYPARGVYTDLDVGDAHVCALRDDGVVECHGDNSAGQAPDSMFTVPGAFTDIAAGLYHSCAVATGEGMVQCWGYNENGAAPAMRFPKTGSFVKVSAGSIHTCALRSDGVIECWGSDPTGALPDSVKASTGTFVDLSAGDGHTCAVRSDGVIQCWGNDFDGQAPATRSATGSTFVGTAGGTSHSCGLRADGLTECWGNSALGATRPDVPVQPLLVDILFPAPGVFQVDWIDMSGAERFQVVQRRTVNVSTWEQVARPAPNVTSMLDAHLVPGALYEYRVRACNTLGCSSWRTSSRVLNGDAVVPPAEPASLTAVRITGVRTDLSWTGGDGTETGFAIERRTRNTLGAWSEYLPVATAPAGASTYSETTVPSGLAHQYRIRACNTAGCSAYVLSSIVTTPPRPTSLSAVPVTGVRVDLGWTGGIGVETGFAIERRTRSAAGVWGPYVPAATAPALAAAYSDVAVPAGIAHQYRIRACDALGCSGYATSAIVNPPVPVTPGGLSIVLATSSSIEIGWIDASPDELTFQIGRRARVGTGAWKPWQALASTDADDTGYIDGSVEDLTRYEYRVRACSLAGCSPWSSTVEAIAAAPPPAPTTVFAAAMSPTEIRIDWEGYVGGASLFRLQRATRTGGVLGPWQTIGQLGSAEASVSDTTVASGTAYRYRLRACNPAGCSSWALTSVVTTP